MLPRLLLAILCCLSLNLHAAGTRLVYPLYFAQIDSRKEYDWLVLRAALDRTTAAYGPYTLEAWRDPLSPQRMVQELARPDSPINVIARATDAELESRFEAVRIPIDRGLMGMRLLLVRRHDLARFAAVRNLNDLRRLSAGQGKGWIDNQVLLGAGISVVETARTESLYEMLQGGRFDFFPRALDEIFQEYDDRHGAVPQMVIEPTLMLRYPLPRYFFLRRNAEGLQLARRIRAGMEMMVKDGSLAALFARHKGPLVARAALARRRVIDLPNPALPPETPLARSELWFRP